jgi:hypothetical protein
LKFVYFQRERVDKKEISGATVINYTKSIKLFCEMADIPIPWKKITRGLPKGKKYADDRIPTLDELKKLVEYPDRRIKAIVYTMASSGMRVGAWDYLRWSHIRPIEKNGQVIAAKIIVYGGEDDEYFSFISPTAWEELSIWMKYRESSGESITEDSWVMRNLWDTRVAQGRGLVTVPKKLTSLGVKRLMERAIWAQGLRKKLDSGKKRHPFQANHSLRKWYSSPRERRHVSDIFMYPRQRVFKEISPTTVSHKDLNMYSSGKTIHEAIQLLFMSNRGRFEKEKYVEYKNIIGSEDIYDQKKNIPIEFKTISSANITNLKTFHVEQLRYYMAILKADIGYVLYQCLMHFENEPFKIFRIKMSEKQRIEQLEKLVQEITTLETALDESDPCLTRHIFFDPNLNWLCKECPYAI